MLLEEHELAKDIDSSSIIKNSTKKHRLLLSSSCAIGVLKMMTGRLTMYEKTLLEVLEKPLF